MTDILTQLFWLKLHFPFSGDVNGSLMSVSTGTFAGSTKNLENTKETGLLAMSQLLGQTFGEVKLKMKSKVTPLAAINGTIGTIK